MRQRPIIPRKLKKQKYLVWNYFKALEFLSLIILGGLITLVIWSLKSFGLITQIPIAVVLGILIFVLFLPKYNETDKKIYYWFYSFFKFILSTKKYKKIEKILDKTSQSNLNQLIKYKKIEEDYIYLSNKKYFGGIELKGINLMIESEEEQEIFIENFRQVIKTTKENFSLIKIDVPESFGKYKGFLEKQVKKSKNRNIKKQLKNNIKLFDANTSLSQTNLTKKFYFSFVVENIKNLKEELNLIYEKTNRLGLKPKILNHYENVNLIKNLLNPLIEDFDNHIIDQNKENLENILTFLNLKFKPSYISINNGEFLSKTQTIQEFPLFPDLFWLRNIMNSNDNVVININDILKADFKEKINKAIRKIKINLGNMKSKDVFEIEELDAEKEVYEQIIEETKYNDEKVKSISVNINHFSASKEELIDKMNYFNKMMEENDIKTHPLTFYQKEALINYLPNSNDKLEDYSQELTSYSLAAGFPILENSIQDFDGVYLGDNSLGDPFILNMYLISKFRTNHNILILGVIGYGKTLLGKKIIDFNVLTGRTVIIVDVEREYANFAKVYNGDWIDLGDNSKNKINPLEIAFEEGLEDNLQLANHLNFLEDFLSVLFQSLTEDDLSFFGEIIGNKYQTLLKEKKLKDLKSEDFFTFSDILDELEKIDDKSSPEYKKIHSILRRDLTGYGKYAAFYNNKSNIRLNSKLVVFDLKSLFQKKNKKLITAQLILLDKFINDRIKNDNNQKLIVFDEAHLFMNNQITLELLDQTVRRIRKRNGSIMLISQNPDEFLGTETTKHKTRSILNNVQYQFIMHLSSGNIKDMNEMYSDVGGFTDRQRDFLHYAQQGDALFINGAHERHLLKVKHWDYEKELFKKEGD